MNGVRRLLERFHQPREVEPVPALSKGHEDAMIKVFETRKALNDELTIDNYWAAWMAEFEAKRYVSSASRRQCEE